MYSVFRCCGLFRIMSIKDNMVTVDATEKMMTKDEVQKILRDGKLRIRFVRFMPNMLKIVKFTFCK